MKIVDLKVAAYQGKHRQPYSNGKYTYATTDICICRVITDCGVEGIGWAHGTEVVYHTMLNLRPYIIGQDPFNTERIWNSMYLPKVFGRKGFETRAISAVDMAMWDIMGKVAGRPIRQLMGGYRDKIPAYIAGGYYEKGKGLKGLQEEMKENLRKGAKAIKMKIGAVSVSEDVERIDAVREAIGPECKLLVDANNAYNRIDALKMGRELDKRDIFWFEEPLSPDDIDGSAELRRKIDTPIAIGENEYTKWGFKELMDRCAADVYNTDALVLGGLTEWKKVADYAQSCHVLIAPHGDQEIHSHLVSSIPNGLIAEYYDTNLNSLLSAMFKKHITLDENGEIAAPSDPGVGVEIDFDTLKQFQIYPKL